MAWFMIADSQWKRCEVSLESIVFEKLLKVRAGFNRQAGNQSRVRMLDEHRVVFFQAECRGWLCADNGKSFASH